jgi:hypothetical protein
MRVPRLKTSSRHGGVRRFFKFAFIDPATGGALRGGDVASQRVIEISNPPTYLNTILIFLSRSILPDMLPCLVVPVIFLCILMIYLRIFTLVERPILANRTYFNAQATRGDISFE